MLSSMLEALPGIVMKELMYVLTLPNLEWHAYDWKYWLRLLTRLRRSYLYPSRSRIKINDSNRRYHHGSVFVEQKSMATCTERAGNTVGDDTATSNWSSLQWNAPCHTPLLRFEWYCVETWFDFDCTFKWPFRRLLGIFSRRSQSGRRSSSLQVARPSVSQFRSVQFCSFRRLTCEVVEKAPVHFRSWRGDMQSDNVGVPDQETNAPLYSAIFLRPPGKYFSRSPTSTKKKRKNKKQDLLLIIFTREKSLQKQVLFSHNPRNLHSNIHPIARTNQRHGYWTVSYEQDV